ncbi:regulatory LuxR family protein [Archangium gephyra]|uniref:Regulatory LuxR family protein n=1 Tax=Archangium gephyra TaxID=48 RepID=A0ABX9JK68_9BACT|nr:helix-turn-helix transcriptional regulator [Archangium gephyra]REG14218.1 regulatory LuxR family protein [Archangium gephyra]
MSVVPRRVPDPLLECYLAGSLDAEAQAEVEVLLAESAVDQARLEELRAESAVFLVQHPSESQLKPFLRWSSTPKVTEEEAERSPLLEALLHHPGSGSLVLRSPNLELRRTDQATLLLERWFAPIERAPGGIPRVLLEQLARLSATAGLGLDAPDVWTRSGPGIDLRVSFMPLPEDGNGPRPWALVLQEVERHTSPLPASMRNILTAREMQVVTCALKGWDNHLIAMELEVSPSTVKKHMQRIFDKLGVSSRAALVTRWGG